MPRFKQEPIRMARLRAKVSQSSDFGCTVCRGVPHTRWLPSSTPCKCSTKVIFLPSLGSAVSENVHPPSITSIDCRCGVVLRQARDAHLD
ncbi:hypothetical protein L1887_56353 [Cichorium endivia]|nr:hypothetical protein L1887_56353 [Cichorium endivia]